ncbi:NADP-dependent phosphogluconate dehydrogenase [Cesiribacter andamanensis]|nr:NADP-dependent phosphogluconate dehydrogenase [Cesiribacter andamanensis]
MICIIMGVSGSGKTTIGQLLAQRLGLPFHDADDFHPPANIRKMQQGQPLTDLDRKDWLEQLAAHIKQWEAGGGAVLACSALKEQYRITLQSIPRTQLRWVFLEGSRALIQQRLKNRTGHFMSPELLDSQLATLEKPDYGIHLNIALSPQELVEQVVTNLNAMNTLSEFGIIGLGVMGKSLALNLAEKGVRLALYNRHVTGTEEQVARRILEEHPHIPGMQGFDDLAAFVASLERPRKILLMIVAGPVVDLQIEALLPLLDAEDVLIDGGNSFYKDTARRTRLLAEKGIEFVGTGISGGEEGARKGPSMMPGGAQKGYQLVQHYLELMAAKDRRGLPCTAYIGPEGAGHFIKMVHNSIEYAEMQALAECYQLMREYLRLAPPAIADTFAAWQQEELNSYLLGITVDIMRKQEGGGLLLDKILDQAEQKGTGGWSVSAALEHGVPYGPLTEAVMARAISSRKAQRVKAATLYQHTPARHSGNAQEFLGQLRGAYQACRILNHHIGFALMRAVSEREGWQLNFSEIARIWTNGCIIRSELMEELVELYKTEEELLLAPSIIRRMKGFAPGFARIVAESVGAGIALPVFTSALNYYLGYQTAQSPANLIQAQRDYFGAHTYRRVDRAADEYFHTEWGQP